MPISSCLKMQLNYDPIAINEFFSSSFQADVDSVVGSTVDDLVAFSHLSNYFIGFTEWIFTTPPSTSNTLTFIGNLADFDTYTGHSKQSLSLCGYTKASLQKQIANNVPRIDFNQDVMPADQWFNLITQAKFSELNSIINDLLYQTNTSSTETIIDQPMTLKIMRCTPPELTDLNLRRGLDTPEYTDAFNIIKDRITRSLQILEDDGFSKAVYHADGDYITFKSECALRLVFSDVNEV